MPKTEEIINREHWLTRLVHELEPLLQEKGHKMPKFRISCGFPAGRSRPKASGGAVALGQCWGAKASGDGTHEIFVSPIRSDAIEIAGTTLHEMVHAVLPEGTGHKAKFARLAKSVGLEGKPTVCAPGDDLNERVIKAIVEKLGPYPHAALDATSYKKQNTNLLKSMCPFCGYVVRVTRKWLDSDGPVICPTCYAPFIDPTEDEPEENPLEVSIQSVEYKLKESGDRFAVRMVRNNKKKEKSIKWFVLDFGSDTHFFGDRPPVRVLPVESREDALATIESIREGLYVPEELDAAHDDVDPEVDILSEEDEEEPDFEDQHLSPEEEAEFEKDAKHWPALKEVA